MTDEFRPFSEKDLLPGTGRTLEGRWRANYADGWYVDPVIEGIASEFSDDAQADLTYLFTAAREVRDALAELVRLIEAGAPAQEIAAALEEAKICLHYSETSEAPTNHRFLRERRGESLPLAPPEEPKT